MTIAIIKVPFEKFHGMGNDFIVSEAALLRGGARQRQGRPDYGELAMAICAPHTGVGADGFLIVSPASSLSADAQVEFFNADGSEAEISGNGLRCAAVYLSSGGRIRKRKQMAVETKTGIRAIELLEKDALTWTFRVGMGAPVLEPQRIPLIASDVKAPVTGFRINTSSGTKTATVTSMGNPHCTLFVKRFQEGAWQQTGREIENKACFPNRTNVEFVRVLSRKEIEVRYWERGVGQTASSGTGSCAAVVASILNGRTGRRVLVRTLAGALQVEWPKGGEVQLTGPAVKIAEGTYWHLPRRP